MASGELSERFQELRTSLEALPDISEPPKSTFRILGSTRSERKWNTFLAYFLDPSQPHGFDVDLLKCFLDLIQEETDTDLEYYHRDLEDVTVETELTSSPDNRLDILIQAPEEWFVWIESKVDASEGRRQLQRYVEDSHVGGEEKSAYTGGHHYLFLSKSGAEDATVKQFRDLSWECLVGAFQERVRQSHGRYPTRSVAQLVDFLSTIRTVTNMDDDDFTKTQQERVRLLSEYRADIDTLLEAAEDLRQRAVEDWPTLFRNQVDDDLWTEEWRTQDNPNKYGCIFKYGWWRDDDNLEPTTISEETYGSTGLRIHFRHTIRKKESFSRGEFKYRLVCTTSVPLRDEINRLYNSDNFQKELRPILKERGIRNKGNKKIMTEKQYTVNQSGLPESYFAELATAFEEHLPIANIVDDIVEQALENIDSH